MRIYRFHWLNGRIELLEGEDATDALDRAGYRTGAMDKVDYYEEL